MVSDNTSSLNTASYLNRTEHSLLVNGFTSDLWYGYSPNDAIELSVWDRSNNFIGWNVITQSNKYIDVQLSYLNTVDISVPYSYTELQSDFILYKNDKILVNPNDQISSSFGIVDGSYFLVYNFTRDMAGNFASPLVIKDISPSRREIKLIPISGHNKSYDAFVNKKVLLKDVSPLYQSAVQNCLCNQIYNRISPLYKDEINIIKTIFFLTTDGEVVTFLQSLYTDSIIHISNPVIKNGVLINNSGSGFRIQGIHTYFENYLLSNSDNIVDFSDLDNTFNGYVSASIERKFSPVGLHPLPPYVKAKAFVYDFFTKYYYQLTSDILRTSYKEKYLSPLKNALNFGDNLLLPIVTHGMMDERVNPEDPLTLLVKLNSELPINFSIQSLCWVSNISFTPYVVNAIIKNPINNIVHTIGPPDFSIPIPNASLTNTNLSYTANDLLNDSTTEREVVVSKNITELNLDYTNFNNFVVFSSAEIRIKIFKNKIINSSALSASIQVLNQKNTNFISASSSIYPFYTQEYESAQSQLNDIVDSFDGYESYLYRTGNYNYTNGQFISSSYIAEMDSSASYYDRNNRDSLINNCPSHILLDPSNDEYITFLSMIGHFFDEIYIYIKSMPGESRVGHNSTEAFTRRIIDYMLETFGWNLGDSIEQSTLIGNYLTSNQQYGLKEMSDEERLKEVRNRILLNLPRIYKTKGTEESVRTILSCYGIPSSLLSIREYGGVNYTDDTAAYTTYERAYMYQWDTSSVFDYFRTNLSSDCKTFLLKVCVDDATVYTHGKEQILMGLVSGSAAYNTISGSGEWSVGFIRENGHNMAKIFFRIGHIDNAIFQMTSSAFPLFDGNIYSIMVRRNIFPDGFQYNINQDAVPSKFDLYVQRNEFGRQIIQSTSSKVSYDYSTNYLFSTVASGSYLMLGGWFSYHNGQGFTGAMDKLQVWNDSITDSNYEDYVNSINAYSFSGSRPAHQSLIYRMHTDYPFDMHQVPPGTIPPGYNGLSGTSTAWIGKWQNANPFYSSNSFNNQVKYLDQSYPANMDMMVNQGAWSGSQELVYNTSSCRNVSQSCYPYQFKIIDYPSTWGISKYGPNKFNNEKVHYVTQSISTRLDDKSRSTYTPRNNTSPDSNQIGFFADPQDFKNKDVVRYFGNQDFMDIIGNPYNQYADSYQSLNIYRKEYATSLNEGSGSRTLFNELITLYKLYFNRSVFDSIKNVLPARNNALVGVLIEPSILERPKYPVKPIYSEVNTGSVFFYDFTVAHYSHDSNTTLMRMTQSLLYGDFGTDTSSISNFDTSTLPINNQIGLNVSYINLPTCDYPVNYLPNPNYIPDIMDDFQLGHFPGNGVTYAPMEPIVPIDPTLPNADFSANILTGESPLVVIFTNLSTNAISYQWDFGDGNTSTDTNPTHTYTTNGTFTVTLVAINGINTDTEIKVGFVSVIAVISYPCGTLISGVGNLFPGTYIIDLGTGTGYVELTFEAISIPNKFIVVYDGVTVIDTGYRGLSSYQTALNNALRLRGLPPETIYEPPSGTGDFIKTTSNRYATVYVYSPASSDAWSFTLGCPI